MNDKDPIYLFSQKNKRAPSTNELVQIYELIKCYGKRNLCLAINRSENGNLHHIGYLLMGLAGFPRVHSDCLNGIILDRNLASKKYSASDLKIADQIRQAIRILPDHMVAFLLNIDGNNLGELWQINTKRLLDEDTRKILCQMTRKFGIDLVKKSFFLLPILQTEPTEILVSNLRQWVEVASTRNWEKLNLITKKITKKEIDDFIPYPYSIRLLSYHFAKTQRDVTISEKIDYWQLLSRYSEDDLIFNMSRITGERINPESVVWLSLSEYQREWIESERIAYQDYMQSLQVVNEDGEVEDQDILDTDTDDDCTTDLDSNWESPDEFNDYSDYCEDDLDSDEVTYR